MTMKHERDAGDTRPDESGVPDEKVDPIVAGWDTALKDDIDDENEDATADEVARGDDVDAELPNFNPERR